MSGFGRLFDLNDPSKQFLSVYTVNNAQPSVLITKRCLLSTSSETESVFHFQISIRWRIRTPPGRIPRTSFWNRSVPL